MLSSSESRRRKKDPDRERSSPKGKEKDRDREERKERHKSKSSRSSSARKTSSTASKEGEREHRREKEDKERVRTPSTSHSLNKMAAVPEMERRGSLGSPNASKTSLPYPSYSKTHSKENIYAKEDTPERTRSPFTPEATDVGPGSPEKQRKTRSKGATSSPSRAPPSPPLTATTAADLRKTASANSMRQRKTEAIHNEMEAGRRSADSGTRLTPEPRFSASRSSIRATDKEVEGTDITSTTSGSQPSTIKQRTSNPTLAPPKVRTGSPSSARPAGKTRAASLQASEVSRTTLSDATSVLPGAWPVDHHPSPTNSEVSPASVVDSSPRTPTQHSVLPSVTPAQKEKPPTVEFVVDDTSRAQSVDSAAYSEQPLTPPPPPPPPTLVDPPRVDYLLQHGGLTRPVPRSLLGAIDNTPATAYNTYTSPRVAGPQAHDVRRFFTPLQRLLDDYNNVMDRCGSLAVATGYRSVARRLLDRLEAVFARNIASEHCQCIMCVESAAHVMNEEQDGVNWGEILELVSGRCDLPSWPPLDHSSPDGLGISALEDPCQNIDVDVPEQYRAHYAQQSQKTKVAVQSWLSNQQDSAPEEADDDTLTFAMLTRLEPSERPLFYALLYGLKQLPTARTPPVPNTGTPSTITKAAVALQRLYRLYAPPRDQVVVMYLIRNPDMHTILATLSAVSKHEWEILVSGRFDGFLWSGAENIPNVSSPPPGGPSRGPSRGPTADLDNSLPQRFATPSGTPFSPFSASRPTSTRPGSTRPGGPAPVQLDEDTEIAVLAEIEREIFLGMEAMEDAFEALHNNAEVVRRRLRERGAALSMFAQARRGPGVDVRMGTPASVSGASFTGVDLDGDALDDLRSEIVPDDSASNVSHNRRGRGHRTRVRRTPAPVEEEAEHEGGESLAERIRRRF